MERELQWAMTPTRCRREVTGVRMLENFVRVRGKWG